jgi:aryl-alcohol dehydrogenase-like predicted oxidoreductase
VIEQAHASLKRLGVDYVDVYYSHRFDTETPLEETLRAFEDLVRQGKVLYVGVVPGCIHPKAQIKAGCPETS